LRVKQVWVTNITGWNGWEILSSLGPLLLFTDVMIVHDVTKEALIMMMMVDYNGNDDNDNDEYDDDDQNNRSSSIWRIGPLWNTPMWTSPPLHH